MLPRNHSWPDCAAVSRSGVDPLLADPDPTPGVAVAATRSTKVACLCDPVGVEATVAAANVALAVARLSDADDCALLLLSGMTAPAAPSPNVTLDSSVEEFIFLAAQSARGTADNLNSDGESEQSQAQRDTVHLNKENKRRNETAKQQWMTTAVGNSGASKSGYCYLIFPGTLDPSVASQSKVRE